MIVLETLLTAMAGFMAWGVAWDVGHPRPGLVIAIIIWVGVSPVLEIATVTRYRRSLEKSEGQATT